MTSLVKEYKIYYYDLSGHSHLLEHVENNQFLCLSIFHPMDYRTRIGSAFDLWFEPSSSLSDPSLFMRGSLIPIALRKTIGIDSLFSWI